MKFSACIVFSLLTFLFHSRIFAQNVPNWSEKQLMEPEKLNSLINTKDAPVIICVGPGAPIPHSVHTGMASDSKNLEEFRQKLSGFSKNREIVIYCGCCPFEHCPNVRPAIEVLKSMGFSNYYLLNLPHNLKSDWIGKGYAVVKE